MNEPQRYVGLDVGGTSMKAAVVDEHAHAGPSASLPTEPELGQEQGLVAMCETIRQAVAAAGLTMRDIAAIGVATPGTMDLKKGVILEPPNLKPWQNVPVRDHIARHFDKPTAFQNDANAAAMGEFWAGAGSGARSLVFFTLGTGVGGGIILNGEVLEGEHSHGAELGHMKIEMTNPRHCGCGKRGCLEAYASATQVVNRTREELEKGRDSSLTRINANTMTARDVFDAAKAGDRLGMEVVDRTAFYLALGASNLMHVIDPEMIVFGGGMIEAGDWFLNQIRAHIPSLAFPVPAEHTAIRFAQLGPDAGFIGAAACARLLVRGAIRR